MYDRPWCANSDMKMLQKNAYIRFFFLKSKKSNYESQKSGMVAFACNLSTWKDEVGVLPRV